MEKSFNVSKIILRYDGKKQVLELNKHDQEEMDIFLEKWYQEELAKTPSELKSTAHKLTPQEFADLINKDEYNSWHKFNRHTSGNVKNNYSTSEENATVNPIELIGTERSILQVEEKIDTEIAKNQLFSSLPAKQVKLLWDVYANNIPVVEIAQEEGVTARAIYLRLQTAKDNFKKIFPNPSLF